MISPEIAVEEAICDKQREAEVQPATDLMPLGELCTIQIGRTPARADSRQWDPQRRTKNVWVSIADMSASETLEISSSKEHLSDLGAASGRIVPAGTILLSFKLSIGKVAVTGCDLYTNEAIAALLLPDDAPVCREFLVWFLRSVDWEKEAAGSDKVKGATLNKKKLSGLLVPVPPVSEQKRIAGALEGIVARTGSIESGALRQKQLVRGLRTTSVAAMFEQENNFVELGEVCEVLDRFRKPLTKRDRKPGPIPYYGASGIIDHVDGYIFDEELVLLGEDGAKWGPGDTSAFVVTGKAWVNNHAHVLRPNHQMVRSQWLIQYLNAADLTPYITGLTVPKLNQAKMRTISIPLPRLAAQDEALARIESLSNRLSALEVAASKQVEAAGLLTQSALSAAFRGEL